jgi:hypothetical protein
MVRGADVMLRRAFLKLLAALGMAPAVGVASTRDEFKAVQEAFDALPALPPKYALIHATEYGGCGKPAILLIEKPAYGTIVRSSNFRHLDGTPVLPLEVRKCDSCGGRRVRFESRFILER